MTKQKPLRELMSERALNKWSETSHWLAILFAEQQDKILPLPAIISAIRELHLNGKIENYSESAVRSVLWRFKRDKLIAVRKKTTHKGIAYYSATSKGLHVFNRVIEILGKISSHKGGPLAQLPRTQLTNESVDIEGSELVDLVVSEWNEYFDWEGAWLEGASLVFTTDEHIAKRLNEHCDKQARKRSAGTKSDISFKLNVWPTTAKVRIWPKKITVEKDLCTWLVEECKLDYHDLRLFFLSVSKGSTENDDHCRSTNERGNTEREFLSNRLGLWKGQRLGEIPGESTETRYRSMVRPETSAGLHQSLWSDCNRDMAKVLRVARVTGKYQRRGHEPGSGLESRNECSEEAGSDTHGLHSEIFGQFTAAAIGGAC